MVHGQSKFKKATSLSIQIKMSILSKFLNKVKLFEDGIVYMKSVLLSHAIYLFIYL